jgi:hypothetical protein
MFVHYPTTSRDQGKASTNSTDDTEELFLFNFPSAALSTRGFPLSVVSPLGRASNA